MEKRSFRAVLLNSGLLAGLTCALCGCMTIQVDIEVAKSSPIQDQIELSVAFAHSSQIDDFSYLYPVSSTANCNTTIYLDRLIYNATRTPDGQEGETQEKAEVDASRPYRYGPCPTALRKPEIGDALRRNAHALVRALFVKGFSVRIDGYDHQAGEQHPFKGIPRDPDGILEMRSPEFSVFTDCTAPWMNTLHCVGATEFSALWVFQDRNHNVIWSKTIVGLGQCSLLAGSLKRIAGKQAQLAIDDHFEQVAKALAESPEIRLFALCRQIDCDSLLRDPSQLDTLLAGLQSEQQRAEVANRLVYVAIEKNGMELLASLLSTKYVDVGLSDRYYKSLPIHLAAKKNSLCSVATLIDSGSDLDEGDSLGRTPLHYAAANGYTEITELLIGRGASTNINDVEGQTAFNLAMTNGCEADWKLLLDNGADFDSKDEENLLGTAVSYRKIGEHLLHQEGRESATEALNLASEYFMRASEYYGRISKAAKGEAFVRDLLKVVTLVAYSWGRQYQAEQNARQYAEIKGLADASKMGLSSLDTLSLIGTYKTAVASLPNHGGGSMTSQTSGAAGYDDVTVTLKTIGSEYQKLSEMCLESSKEVLNLLR